MNPTLEMQPSISLEVRGLRKSFDGQPVLRDVNLFVEPGEVFVVMGPSGSGKSVLLKHMVGLEVPDAGEIRLNGEILHELGSLSQYRVGMVFQSGALLNSLTVGENVGLYLSEHHLGSSAEIAKIVAQKLKIVGLKDIEHKFPSELSGGMKKRVAIARALVIEPQLMLYDEPTAELDPLMAVVIAREILRLNQTTHSTTIIVSHDRELAFGIADRIAIILEGSILVVGTPDEIRSSSNPLVQSFITASVSKDRIDV